MKHIRHVIAMTIAAACFFSTHASDVTREMAIAAAEAWMAANPSFSTTGSVVSAVAEYDGDTILWWTVATSSGGAVFVSPETSIDPILAAVPQYSGSLPAAHPLRAILSRDVAKRRSVIASAIDASAAVVAAAERRWTKYTMPKNRLKAFAGAPEGVTVLAEVPGFGEGDNGYLRFWNQEDYQGQLCFNLYTPENAVCGCVATAGAALLQYFGATGLTVNVTRECTYNGAPISLTTISATNHYDWTILPESMGGESTQSFDDIAEDATALLGRATYDVGVCVKMEYTSGESGATLKDLASALTGDFGFMTARYIELGTNGNFSAVYEDLCRTNPVALGIRTSLPPFGGHAILAVGYGEDADTNRYTRLFMGWGGNGDAWYNLPDIQSGSHVFDIVDDAIVSISLDPPIKGAHRTLEEAKAAALENHKAILLVSGTVGDKTTGTDALVDFINDNAVTNDFEIYFAEYSADPYADQNPSYGVFNPMAFNNDIDNRWAFYNGRLAYNCDTNGTNYASCVADFAATRTAGVAAWDAAYAEHLRLLAAAENGITVSTTNAVQYFNEDFVGDKILSWWWDNQDRSDIDYVFWDWSMLYVTTAHDPVVWEDELYVTDCSWKGESYVNTFADGETVTLQAPAVVTNVEDGVVLECAGWLLEAYGGSGWEEVDSDYGNVAEFTVDSNTTYRVKWFWDPFEMRLIASATPTDGGSVSPRGTAWYPYGDTVTLVESPDEDDWAYDWRFSYWSGDTAGCTASGDTLEVPMDMPRSIKACFKMKNSSSSTLTVVSDPAAVTAEVVCNGNLLAYGDNQLSKGLVSIEVPELWQDEDGEWWQCTNWYVTGCCDTNGTNTVAKFDLTGNATLTWQWGALSEIPPDPPDPPTPLDPAEIPIGPVVGGVTNSALIIYSTNNTQLAVETRVSNAVAGYWYSICQADEVSGPYTYVATGYEGTAKCKVEDPVPEILSLIIVFDPAEAAKFYRVVVTEEEPE